MIEISNETAKNFLINYQNLNMNGNLKGSAGVVEYMTKVRCIQYDPLNVVGRNADLVLQSRITNYRSEVLFDLLYKDRTLYDAPDKMISAISDAFEIFSKFLGVDIMEEKYWKEKLGV